MSTSAPPPEPSETAKVAKQGCSFLLWIAGAFIVLIVLGAVVRGCTGGDDRPQRVQQVLEDLADESPIPTLPLTATPPPAMTTPTSTPLPLVQGLSTATRQCLSERTDGQYEQVVARMYRNPNDPETIITADLMYGCFTDDEAERLYPEIFAIYPPSVQRCAEDAMGWEAFEADVRGYHANPEQPLADEWVACLSATIDLEAWLDPPTPAMGAPPTPEVYVDPLADLLTPMPEPVPAWTPIPTITIPTPEQLPAWIATPG